MLLANVLNLIEADSIKDLIYLNFDQRSIKSRLGIWNFLAGEAKWSEVKLQKAVSVITRVAPGDAHRRLKFINSTRRRENVCSSFKFKSYEMIISRALDVEYKLENSVLQTDVDDIYIFAFLEKLDTAKLELFSCPTLDRGKVKGLFLSK